MQKFGHRHIIKLFYLFSEGQLPEKKKKQIEKHLKSCHKCSHVFRQFSQINYDKEPSIINQVPQRIWYQIMAKINTRQSKSKSITYFSLSHRLVQALIGFMFMFGAFGIGYFLTDLPQTSSTNNSESVQFQRQYFSEIQLDWLSSTPPQTILNAMKSMNVLVLEGAEEK